MMNHLKDVLSVVVIWNTNMMIVEMGENPPIMFTNVLIVIIQNIKGLERVIQMSENIIEQLAMLEHNQWMEWSKHIAKELLVIVSDLDDGVIQVNVNRINDILTKWKNNWKPYDELDEETKKLDRIWAVKVMRIVEPFKLSEFNLGRVQVWLKYTEILKEADDNTICPLCKKQMIGCDCVQNMAQDILESKFVRKIHVI